MTRHESFADPAAIRAQLDHPVIDCDGHYTEFAPVFRELFIDAIGRIAGSALRDEVASHNDLRLFLLSHSGPMGQAFGSSQWIASTPEQRRDTWTPMPGWGPPHANALDRATAFLPHLRAERLEEIGIDYSILYPSSALFYPHIDRADLRQAACRALNLINAETYAGVKTHMTPAAAIPMATPEEAIAEIDYAIGELGLKVAMIGSVTRPIPAIHRSHPELYQSVFRLDSFGLDSEYDYDPFWARCADLKVPLVSHGTAYATGFRRSPSNYNFNHAGNFAEAGDVLCRSLFLGGVTRRFPSLRFQFLECGAGWACMLFAEMVHRWEKRNARAVASHVEASLATAPEFRRLMLEHGDERIRRNIEDEPHGIALQLGTRSPPDDFARIEVESVEEIRDLFVPRFYFGCEADDPMTTWAFRTDVNPCNARLRAVLGSDMGHWDVPDIRGILPEAREMVERGLITEDDFRRFTFEHAREFFGIDPNFFKGTRVEPYLAT
jgi:predicted TIM-barrel fold metal-dependent hydrolase